MGETLATLLVSIGVDTDKLKSGLGDAEKQVTSAFSGLSGAGGIVAGAIGVAAVGGFAALTAGIGLSISEASAAQKIMAQTDAVIKSTGGAAGMTSQDVGGLASTLSKVIPIEDDVIAQTENMLLTFTNIKKENGVFEDTTQMALDMAFAIGKDPVDSAVMLGKALNDPIKGVGALRIAGVALNEEQEKLIKTMVEGGDVAGAQALILGELQTEFGGSAAAAGGTFEGQLTIAMNALKDVAEEIGTGLLPVLTELLQKYIVPAIPKIAEFARSFADMAARYIPVVVAWIENAVAAFRGIGEWLGNNQGVIVGILAALGVALIAFGVSAATAAAAAATAAAAAIAPMLPAIAIMAAIGVAAYALYQIWTNNMGGIQEKVGAAWAVIVAAFTVAKDAIIAVWNTFMTIIQPLVAAFQAAMSGDWYAFGENLRLAWDAAWKAIGAILTGAWSFMQNIMISIITNIVDFFKHPFGGSWAELGMSIITGIVNGINGGVGAIINAAKNAASAALDAAKGFLGIHSPSKVFEMQVGAQMGAGMVNGFENSVNVGAINSAVGSVVPAAQQAITPQASGSGSVTNITINNPRGETAEDSIRRQMRSLNFLGVAA